MDGTDALALLDEALAEKSRPFQYEFRERSLAGCVVLIAGGTGRLGVALFL